jgi:F-type H+-transporting ATPase subunit epsilon
VAQFKLTIVSPRDKVFDQDADMLIAPGSEGEFGVLANHAPMIALVKHGVTRVTVDGQERIFFTGEGFVEVSHNAVSMLVDHAEKTDTLDQARTMLAEHLKETEEKKAVTK